MWSILDFGRGHQTGIHMQSIQSNKVAHLLASIRFSSVATPVPCRAHLIIEKRPWDINWNCYSSSSRFVFCSLSMCVCVCSCCCFSFIRFVPKPLYLSGCLNPLWKMDGYRYIWSLDAWFPQSFNNPTIDFLKTFFVHRLILCRSLLIFCRWL